VYSGARRGEAELALGYVASSSHVIRNYKNLFSPTMFVIRRDVL